MIAAARATLFYLGYALWTVTWGTLSPLLAWSLPLTGRFNFIVGTWTRGVLWWLKITCGVKHKIEGLENLPDTPCVILVKHQSTWETLFVQTLVSPQATLIKRELLWIPFFGWAFAMTKPIAINRSNARDALRRLIEVGADRLRNRVWVTLFPEGTRTPWGEQGRFHPGGAALAAAVGAPVVVIAHDAGRLWPAHVFRKRAGTIRVRISEPIPTEGKKTNEINHLAKNWLDEQMRALEATVETHAARPAQEDHRG
ncbi:MAG: lysophospholipid acyltransferase family protein [Gammaproteobacteria bacterium]|nr:lysophospholipid acyltransferase family protein [Gammaproteobacteria bacterium]